MADQPGGASTDQAQAELRRRRPSRTRSGFMSPRARRAAASLGVDPRTVAGSGRDGRVTARDIETTARARASRRVPLNRIQLRAGVALRASTQQAAHAWTAVACDYTRVEIIRRARRDAFRAEHGVGLTYLPFVARAVIGALGAHPAMNATVTADGELRADEAVNLGIAVDLDQRGLVVPVVPNAQLLTLAELAAAIVDVADRARTKRLRPDDIVGATFTLTNPGAAGTYVSVPIINRPQVAILSTDGVAKRVVAVTTGGPGDETALGVRRIGHLCTSFDQQYVTPDDAARFTADVRAELEQRDWSREV